MQEVLLKVLKYKSSLCYTFWPEQGLWPTKNKKIIFSQKWILQTPNDSSYLDAVMFLGGFFDKHSSWSHHIDFIAPRLSRIIYLLRRLLNNVSILCVRNAYFPYFQSVMQHAAILWGNCSSRTINVCPVTSKESSKISTVSNLDHWTITNLIYLIWNLFNMKLLSIFIFVITPALHWTI